MLPAGWRTDEPFIAETAAGVRAHHPTATFISVDGSSVITLNPLRWLESSGTCSASSMGELCLHGQPNSEALLAGVGE
jgi:ABC-type microcin C transport system permease subunit YejE